MKTTSDASATGIVPNGTVIDATGSGGVDSTLGAADTPWCKAKAVLDAHCISCHNPQHVGGAPMSLQQYADLLALVPGTSDKQVYTLVGQRIHDTQQPMPPRADLLPNELGALDAFVATGAPQGDITDCDAARVPVAGVTPGGAVLNWPPKECDAVYKITAHGADPSTPYVVPAGQEIHPKIDVDAPWGDEPVQAIAFRTVTDNAKVLHHWILYSKLGTFLTGWAPGDNGASQFSSDIGMNMPTGPDSMMLDMHYFNTQGTQVENDASGLEVCVVKAPHLRAKAAAVTMGFSSFGIGQGVLAPPGAVKRPVTGVCKVTTTSPVHLMNSSPHAHLHARHMTFTVQKSDGTRILLHDDDFQFSEQRGYPLSPEVVIETGDIVYTSCFYTNDTNQNLTWGESTTNEMCFNFAMYWPAGALRCEVGTIDGLPP